MNDNKSNSNFSELKGIHKAIPIILGAVAVFIAACMIIPDIMGAA